jgi:hypothetical protein
MFRKKKILENPDVRKKRGGCWGCFKWILYIIAALFIVCGIIAIFLFRVPEKLGLMPNKAEKLLVTTPDRGAANDLLEEAQASGLSTQGVSLFVFPHKEGNGNVAVAVFDAREGFSFSQGGQLDPVGQAFAQIASGPTAERLNIERVTITYISEQGADLMSMSAKRSDAVAFANGSMTQEEFINVLAGDVNLPAIVDEQIDSINRMMQ